LEIGKEILKMTSNDNIIEDIMNHVADKMDPIIPNNVIGEYIRDYIEEAYNLGYRSGYTKAKERFSNDNENPTSITKEPKDNITFEVCDRVVILDGDGAGRIAIIVENYPESESAVVQTSDNMMGKLYKYSQLGLYYKENR
jgi:hypothetical protein